MWFLCFYGALHMFLLCLGKNIIFIITPRRGCVCESGGNRIHSAANNIAQLRFAMCLSMCFYRRWSSTPATADDWIQILRIEFLRLNPTGKINKFPPQQEFSTFSLCLCGFYECRLQHKLVRRSSGDDIHSWLNDNGKRRNSTRTNLHHSSLEGS